MGKIVHVPAGLPIGHKHEEPPNGPDLLQYPRGTIWECSCGAQRRLDNDQREGWIWVWTTYVGRYSNASSPGASSPVGGEQHG